MNLLPLIPPLQLSSRAALAAGVAVAVAQLMGLRYPLYAMIATVIVTDLAPSQTRKLALSRLVGTVVGAALGAGVSSLLHSTPFVIGLAIFAAMFISHILHLEHAARVAGYICGIVVLEHGSEPWSYALYRTIETIVGIVVAVLVSSLPKLIRIDETKFHDR